MKLRHLLDRLGNIPGMMSEEKGKILEIIVGILVFMLISNIIIIINVNIMTFYVNHCIL